MASSNNNSNPPSLSTVLVPVALASAAAGAALFRVYGANLERKVEEVRSPTNADRRASNVSNNDATPGSPTSINAPRETTLAQPTLVAKSEKMIDKLQTTPHGTVQGVSPEQHYLAPIIAKHEWTALGDDIAARERFCSSQLGTANVSGDVSGSSATTSASSSTAASSSASTTASPTAEAISPASPGSVPGEFWISLRLDGSNFSKTVKQLRANNIIEGSGFSELFAKAMQNCCQRLMERLNGVIGYTQSDEMCIFIPPTGVVRGERQPHVRSGRVVKLCTLAAGFVSTNFVLELGKLARERLATSNPAAYATQMEQLLQLAPHFDCRLGAYRSFEEARSLLIWRAYDCSINGVSDAVYHFKENNGKDGKNNGKDGKGKDQKGKGKDGKNGNSKDGSRGRRDSWNSDGHDSDRQRSKTPERLFSPTKKPAEDPAVGAPKREVRDPIRGADGALITRKQAMEKSMRDKLKWLAAQDVLPLPKHQGFGCYFVKVKRTKEAWDPRQQKTITVERGVIEKMEGYPVLELARDGKLLDGKQVDGKAPVRRLSGGSSH